MSQNRNKLLEFFIGNVSNSVVHRILEKAIDEENIRKHYDREFLTSLEVAKKYREKINPKSEFPEKDAEKVRQGIINKVNKELKKRESKGYKNINFGLIDGIMDEILKKMRVIS